MDSWVGGSAPGAGLGSRPPQHGPVALRPHARRLCSPVWMTGVPAERGSGALLRDVDRRNLLYLNVRLQPHVWAEAAYVYICSSTGVHTQHPLLTWNHHYYD